MNQIFYPGPPVSEVDAVRGAIDALALPEFIESYEVRLGEFDGEPAVWVIFPTNVDDQIQGDALDEHIRARFMVRDAVTTAIYRLGGSRSPVVRFLSA